MSKGAFQEPPDWRKKLRESDRSGPTDPTDQTDQTNPTDRTKLHRPRRLRPSGGYRQLRSFQTATLIYDGTVSFCGRFVAPHSRTHDQMVQAARSGRQNIAEGSRASATSSKSETHLTNVARASLDELLLDFEDFLRQHKLPQWAKDAPEAQAVRKLGRKSDPTGRSDPSDSSDTVDQMRWARYAPWIEHKDPGNVANALICLIHQANYLLDQQIAALERAIIEEGGYREKLTAARLAERERKNRSDPTDQIKTPACPLCGKPMKQRTARQGKHAGSRFWGCIGYPDCKGTRPVEEGKNPTDPTDRSNLSDRFKGKGQNP